MPVASTTPNPAASSPGERPVVARMVAALPPTRWSSASVPATAPSTASPPSRGVGCRWTRRGPGASTAPSRRAMARTRGVTSRLSAAALAARTRSFTVAELPSATCYHWAGVARQCRRRSGEDVARTDLRGSSPERRGGLHAHAAHAKRHGESVVHRAAQMHLAARRAEHDLAVLAELESGSLETVGDAAGPVAEAEHAAFQRALRGDEREVVAVDLSFVIRELERERGVRWVERADAGSDTTAPESQAVPGRLGPHAHDHPAQRERVDPLAAVRILVVDETVAV